MLTALFRYRWLIASSILCLAFMAHLARLGWLRLRETAAHRAAWVKVSWYGDHPSVDGIGIDQDWFPLSESLCSDSYLQAEYNRTKDISIFYLLKKRRNIVIVTSVIQDEMRLNAGVPLDKLTSPGRPRQ